MVWWKKRIQLEHHSQTPQLFFFSKRNKIYIQSCRIWHKYKRGDSWIAVMWWCHTTMYWSTFFFLSILYINPKVNFIFLITFRLKFVWLNSYFNTILIVITRQARSSNNMNARTTLWRCLGEQFNIKCVHKIKDKRKIIIRRVCCRLLWQTQL